MLAKDGRVVLIDFGAARISTGAETKSLTVLLKHGYAPVEQYQTQGKQGPYTDIYAVCATMYRMLSGKKPEEAIDRIVEDKVIPLEQRRDIQVSYQVSSAIQKGLSIQAWDRYQTVEELIYSLYENELVFENSKYKIKAGIKLRDILMIVDDFLKSEEFDYKIKIRCLILVELVIIIFIELLVFM